MSIYEVNKITNSLYSIKEDITDNKFPILIYLIIGTKKAAIIDTGLGTGNLKQIIESITNLPIVVLHSHGHIDHVGADTLFTKIYLNSKDYNLIDNSHDFKAATEQRMNFIEVNLKDKLNVYEDIKAHIVKIAEVNYKNIDDGDIVDLGGIQLEAISTPGHTLGSISYVNKKDHIAFTGDGIADIHWFNKSESICVEGFLNTLNHFEDKTEGVKNVYAAHIPEAFNLELVHDLQTAAKEIINGSKDKIENADYQFLKYGDLYAHRHGFATIYYDKENIHYKEKLCQNYCEVVN